MKIMATQGRERPKAAGEVMWRVCGAFLSASLWLLWGSLFTDYLFSPVFLQI